MLLNPQNIDLAFKGFKAIYTDAFTSAPIAHDRIAMMVPSSSREETYGWLGQFPQMREWLGGTRVIKDLAAHSFAITNRKFESTVNIRRDDFSDDRLGIFKPMFAEMGHTARQHPDELIFQLLQSGFTSLCYDGQYFFDTDHPTVNAAGTVITVSNVQSGAGPAWFLFDTSRAVRALIWQEREKYEFESLTAPSDSHVFMTDEYVYGVRARVNAGFGLWQLAFASQQPLSATNYAAARASMMKLRGDQGRVLGITPNLMGVGPDNEAAARAILLGDDIAGSTNPWKGTAELIVTPYL